MFFWGNVGGGSRNQPPNNCGLWVCRGSPAAPSCANTGAVNRVTAAQFNAGSGLITFDEFPNGTVNPVYLPADYGAGAAWEPRVEFCPALLGQTFTSPPLTNNGNPTAPPTFEDYGGLLTRIVNDTSRPPGEFRSIAGAPGFAGPVSMIFTEPTAPFAPQPVVGVGFNVGTFNEVGLCRIRAWDVAGNLLGTWTNLAIVPPFEDFFLNRDSNVPIIAAVALDAIGDTAGLTISRVRFSNTCA